MVAEKSSCKSDYTIAIIPARGGSKGIPRKNLMSLAGKPLVAHSIEAGLRSASVDRTIVSTEDEEIAYVARSFGAEVIMRPPALAQDTSPTEPCMIHVVEELEKDGDVVDLVVLLQPTTPLRPNSLIDDCIAQLQRESADSLVTGCESHYFFWTRTESGLEATYDPVNRPRRQDMAPRYIENGNLYVTRKDLLVQKVSRLGGKISLYEMTHEDSLDIDTTYDFWLAEQLLNQRGSHA